MMYRKRNGSILAYGLIVTILGACGSDSPSGPSVTISAPTIISPAAGEEVTEDRPTLTVGNATVSNNGPATYTFQVATDSSFSDIVAQVTGIPGGADGQTSWQVTPPLANGAHFWRARARAANIDGAFSTVTEFSVLAAFKSQEPRDGLLVFDPLTDGFTVGTRKGGRFTEEGWLTVSRANEIVYNVPTIENGFLEVDIKGLPKTNPGGSGARHLFIMWDPTQGDFTRNRWRAGVQKHTRGSTDTNRYLRMRWIFDGREQHDVFSTFLNWEPDRFFHFRLEWGRSSGSGLNAVRLFIDDRQEMFFNYNRTYAPPNHRIALGAAQRYETPVDAIYANVRIGTRE